MKQFAGATPKGALTGRAHPECFLRGTLNCSEKVSGEHYFSNAVIRAFMPPDAKTATISGAAWLPVGEARPIGFNALTAKILCSRHNSTLSPLDTSAARIAELMAAAYNADGIPTAHRLLLASGEEFEAWMLKLAVAGFLSGSLARDDGKPMRDLHTVDLGVAEDVFAGKSLPFGCGVVGRVGLGQVTIADPPFKASGLVTSYDNGKLCGVDVSFCGLDLRLIFVPEIAAAFAEAGWMYRPAGFRFERDDFHSTLKFCWPDGSPQGPEVVIGLTRPEHTTAAG